VGVESILWIVGGIIAVLVAILLVPVLVIGTWFVVMAVIMGIALMGAYGCWTENGRGRDPKGSLGADTGAACQSLRYER
jgi:hypothetical protein